MRIARARRQRNVSQSQLARSLGLPLQTLKACEAGLQRITAEVLCAICRLLDTRPSFFFEDMKVTATVPTLVDEAQALPRRRVSRGGGVAIAAPLGVAIAALLAPLSRLPSEPPGASFPNQWKRRRRWRRPRR